MGSKKKQQKTLKNQRTINQPNTHQPCKLHEEILRRGQRLFVQYLCVLADSIDPKKVGKNELARNSHRHRTDEEEVQSKNR